MTPHILRIFLLLGMQFQVQTLVSASLRLIPNILVPVVKTNDSWSVTCEGDEPVNWKLDGDQNSSNPEYMNIEYGNSTDSNNYSATLSIDHAHPEMVQPYVCYYNNSSKSDMLKVHLQVDDEKVLFVPNTSSISSYFVVHARINFPVTLPCIPTSKFVKVKLFLNSGTHEWTQNDTSVTYDETRGFTINTVTIEDDKSIHRCEAIRGNVTAYLNPSVIIKEELTTIPRIDHSKAESIRVGESFTLNCSISYSNRNFYYKLQWIRPSNDDESIRKDTDVYVLINNKQNKIHSRILTVANATKEDAGDYVCLLTSFSHKANSTYNLPIYGKMVQFLNVTAMSSSIVETSGKTAKWIILMSGVPIIEKMEWFDKNGERVTNKKRFNINGTNSKEVVLSISNVSLDDDGVYQFNVTNGELNRTLYLNLTVEGEPKVIIKAEGENVYGNYFHVDTNVKLICQAQGFPHPQIMWELEECEQQIGEESPHNCSTKELGSGRQVFYNDNGKGTISSLPVKLTKNGYINCRATNKYSDENYDKEIKLIDFKSPSQSGFDLLGNPHPIEKLEMNLTCAARKLNFANDIKWFKEQNGKWISLEATASVETPWSYKSYVKINNINERQTGNYSCSVSNLSGGESLRHMFIEVQKMIQPEFTPKTTLKNKTLTHGRGDNIPELICEAVGTPEPTITWFWNGKPETEWKDAALKITKVGRQSLLKVPSKVEYEGTYTCQANNGYMSELFMTINIDGDYWWVIVVGLGCTLLTVIVYLVFKICKDRKEQLKLMKLLQDELVKGAPGDINPELPLHEQVNLLPYLEIFEIPREKIILGMLLGQGAFGKVLKAEVLDAAPGGRSVIAAVKMVKANSNQSHLDALAKELKILVHLGKNVNVVNLVGACTKNYAKKKELLVVVEYCRYGNLLKYVHRHRKDFQNQLNSSTGKIDPAYCASRLNRPPSQSQSSRPDSSRYLKMDQVPQMPDITMQVSLNPGSNNYVTGSNARSAITEMSFISDDRTGTDGRRMSSDSAIVNYRGDYQNHDVEPITTTTLVCWSFQIANGMEYLASRNVVHGDLAARNILLADNDVVKICDFGLAREMYRDVYQKQKDKTDLLPVKWMAIESIRDFKFSTKSDVWSFGVVLWELFTLGNSPYPGMEPDAEFYNMLRDGYRMSRPEFASSEIYDLMNKCWDIIPENRPNFASIADDLGDMCDQSLREHYIALNEDCTRENRRMLEEGREDYLMQMPVSDIVVRSTTPDDRAYVNVTPEVPNDDYLTPLAVNRPTDYVIVQPEQSNFVNNVGYHTVNPSALNQISPNHVNIFNPRPVGTDCFGFGGVELTDLSTSNQNTNEPSVNPEENNEPQVSPETRGFSNNSYVAFNTDMTNAQDRNSNSLEVFDSKSILQGLVKTDLGKRKKNDSGVSSSSSGHASDSESPRSSLKELNSVRNGFIGSRKHDIIVENQNYFNSNSILPGETS